MGDHTVPKAFASSVTGSALNGEKRDHVECGEGKGQFNAWADRLLSAAPAGLDKANPGDRRPFRPTETPRMAVRTVVIMLDSPAAE